MLIAALLFAISVPVDEIAFMKGGEVWICDHDGTSAALLVDDAGFARPLTWSPDGRFLIHWGHASGKWDLYRLELSTRKSLNLTTKLTGGSRSPSFSPDGNQVAFVNDGEAAGVYVTSVDGTGLKRVSLGGYRDFPPQWSSDGERLVYAEQLDGSAMRLVLATISSGEIKPFASGYDAVRLRSREWLVVSSVTDGGAMMKVVEEESEHVWEFRDHATRPVSLARSPSGNQLALGDGNEVVIFSFLPPGDPLRFDLKGKVKSVSWSSDGRRIAASVDGESSEVWLVEVESKTVKLIAEGEWASIRPRKP